MHTHYRRPSPPKPVVNPRWRIRNQTAASQETRTALGFPSRTRAEREREILAEM